MFDKKSLDTLEYGKILAELAVFAQSEGGKRDALSLAPKTTLEAAERELSLTAEADRILFDFSVNPSFAVDEIDEVLQKADKGAVLSIPEILRVGRALRIARRVSSSVAKVNGIPLVSEMTAALYCDDALEKRIFDAFISDTEIADAHKLIADTLESMGMGGTPILYGASVKGANAAQIMSIPNVDGVLVGGASLKPDDFIPIRTSVK